MGEVLPFTSRGQPKQGAAAAIARPAAVFYADCDGHYSFVNLDWSRLAGIEQAEAWGEGWLQSVHPHDRLAVAQLWQETVGREGFFNLEYRLSMPLQRLVWVLCQAMPQYDKRGTFIGYGGMLFNVTAYRNGLEPLAALPAFAAMSAAEREAGGREMRMRQILDIAGLAYFEHDLKTDKKTFSPALRELYGGERTLEEFPASLHPEDKAGFLSDLERGRVEGSPIDTEFRLAMPGGGWRKIKTTAKFICGDDGAPTHLVGVCADAEAASTSDGNMHLDILRRVVS